MKSEWTKKKLSDIADFNPRETIKKGAIAKKIPMDVLRPFYRNIPYYVEECFSGGTKFRNGDTIMARITPCLENGKTAQVSILNDGEVGFGSTEYIVFRAKEGIVDKDYLYYLVCSPEVREPAIKSMVGSSGRQRVQTDVVKNLEIDVPPLVEQEKIGSFLKAFDDKIALNDRINKKQAEKLSNVEVKSQDILLNITGDSVARACAVDVRVLPARVNQHVAIIRPNEDEVLSSYILFYLQMMKPYLLQIAAGGATRNALTKGMIENLELEVPDILFQKKIVSILDDIQEKIRENKEINKNLAA